jgi:hypothetical protein
LSLAIFASDLTYDFDLILSISTCALQSLVKDMHTELADGTDTVVIAPGTLQVTLPWHKHFFGQACYSFVAPLGFC